MSGYLDLTLNNRKIHYVYFESQSKPSSDPIIVWFTGGPGCSGMNTMLQENGPFVFRPGTDRIEINKHAWNQNAGLVYFETPGGVGFSTGNEGGAVIHEEDAVIELLIVMNTFMRKFVTVRKNDFYFAGSGYGATIATHLARRIVDQNKQEAEVYKINLKGLLLGNPCVYPDECFNSGSERQSHYHYEFLYKRGFFSKRQYNEFEGACMSDAEGPECYKVRQTLDTFYAATNTSAYNIYNKCYNSSKENFSLPNSINLGCEDEKSIIEYINDEHFKENWNIKSDKIWQPCSKEVFEHYVQGNGSFHLLHRLADVDGIRIWVYSGDLDSTIPFIGTKKWVQHYRFVYNVPIKKNWREWWVPGKHSGEDQVGGFVWELLGLTVVAVKGAGFKTSADQAQAMSEVVEAFLKDTHLPHKHELKFIEEEE